MIEIDEITTLHRKQIIDFCVSPDEKYIAYVYGNRDLDFEKYANDIKDREIRVFDMQEGRDFELIEKGTDAHSPAWSNDGSKLAYLALVEEKMQVHILDVRTNEIIFVSEMVYVAPNAFDGCFDNAKIFWSPDDRYVVTTFLPQGSSYYLRMLLPNIDAEQGIFVEGSAIKEDISKYTSRFLQYLLVCDVSELVCTLYFSSKEPYSIHGFNGNETVVIGIQGQLETVNIVTNTRICLGIETKSYMKIVGEAIYFAEACDGSIRYGKDQEIKGSSDLNGEAVTPIDIAEDGSFAIFTMNQGLNTVVIKLHDDNRLETVLNPRGVVAWKGEQAQASPKILRDYKILYVFSDSKIHHEFYLANGEEVQQLSEFNTSIVEKCSIEVVIDTYCSDGDAIETIMLLPKDFDVNKQYPALIYLHGGPNVYENATLLNLISARGDSVAVSLCQQGFVVAIPNYRGTRGYGVEHMKEVPYCDMEFIEVPYRDVLNCRGMLLHKYKVNEQKIGVYGTSYGAQIVGWAVSHCDYFYKAAPIIGIGYDNEFRNKQSTKSEDFWVHKDEKYQYYSIINYVDKIKCPMMIIETGQAEGKKYVGQVLYNALCAYKNQVTHVIYGRAFHGGGWTDVYKKDYIERLSEFFSS